MSNLYQRFVEAAETHAERRAIVWDDGELTYAELLDRVRSMVEAMAPHVSDDMPNIGLVAPNTPNFMIGLLGILGAGGVVVPFNPLYPAGELSGLIKHSGMKTLLYDPVMKPLADGLSELFGDSLNLLNVEETLAAAQGLKPQERQLPPPETVSMILYTSGTTGDPKGVMLSHTNVSINYDQFMEVLHFKKEYTLQVVLPLFHTFAMTANLFGGLLTGACMRLHLQFDPAKLLDFAAWDEQVVLTAVPPMYALFARKAPEGYPEQCNVACAISGGGPLPVEVAELFEAKTGSELLEGYGLTETSPVISLCQPGKNCIGTAGFPLFDIEVEIRGPEGEVLPQGEVGELCSRGPMVMMGYYRNEAETANVLSEDGWLRTGDLARLDEEGRVQIVGRCKDLIIDSGENIYPREIEDVLMEHPTVLEAAVVGRKHKLRGEIPHAFVTANPEAETPPDSVQLRAFCRERLAAFKVPEKVTLIEEFAKTATKKIQKNALRDILNKA